MPVSLQLYRSLRDDVEVRSASLTAIHSCNLACKAGCHDCCTDISVFPVEFDAILAALRNKKAVLPPPDPSAACAFLQNGLCAIYEHRPMICRTHGLPIAFTDHDDATKNVDFCPKNFTSVPPRQLKFDETNTLDLDDLNFKLYEINADHVEAQDMNPVRIPLRRLHEELK